MRYGDAGYDRGTAVPFFGKKTDWRGAFPSVEECRLRYTIVLGVRVMVLPWKPSKRRRIPGCGIKGFHMPLKACVYRKNRDDELGSYSRITLPRPWDNCSSGLLVHFLFTEQEVYRAPQEGDLINVGRMHADDGSMHLVSYHHHSITHIFTVEAAGGDGCMQYFLSFFSPHGVGCCRWF